LLALRADRSLLGSRRDQERRRLDRLRQVRAHARQDGRDVFDLLGIIRVRVELPDVRELIRNQDLLDKPAFVIVDGVGLGRGIVPERLPATMPGLEVLLNKIAAFPDGRYDDQVDAGMHGRGEPGTYRAPGAALWRAARSPAALSPCGAAGGAEVV
jgi:hypothetical protein